MIDAQLEALAVDTRRQIYKLVLGRPRSVGELAEQLPVSRPAVSQHLKVLSEAGLVSSTSRGTKRVYSADPDGLAGFRDWADQMWADAIERFADFATIQEKEMEMLAEQVSVEPVVKSLRLQLSAVEAFRLFTEEIASWWPLETHSIGLERAVSVRFEMKVGGRILETTGDGVEREWGTVVDWDHGKRIEFTWHPGTTEDQQTLVEVRFRETAGGTEMILVHTGWEARGDEAAEARDSYEVGWDHVLARFTAAL